MLDVAIIGCGIVGAAVAYELAQYQLNIAVFEEKNDVACATTRANSAIIHAGYDPIPGTLMARLNIEGAQLAKNICRRLDVPYKQVGSLVLAFTEEEARHLRVLQRRGEENGVPHLELLTGPQARAMDVNLSKDVRAALYAPTAAIVNPWEYCLAMAETAVQNGVILHLNHKITHITKTEGGFRLSCASQSFDARFVVNAAGIYADEVHQMAAAPSFTIHPNRGQYYLLDKSEGNRVRHIIFQCPGKNGKGVLIAPTVHGNLLVGPNAEPCVRADSSTTAAGLAYVANTAKKSVPNIDFHEVIRSFSGIRALTDEKDFIIGEAPDAPGFISLAGICSPGLSAAPAIARMATGLLGDAGLKLQRNERFLAERRILRFHQLPLEEKQRIVAAHPTYGNIVCRCETITEGEVRAAFGSPIPPTSMDGVKRRCGTGMGRCQSGFCGPKVVELLCENLGISPTEVLQDCEGSIVLAGGAREEGQQHV